jgi:ketosteroid isomerase-like protein
MHPNEELLRRLYDGDRQALYERMASDYVVHVAGTSAAAGDFTGPDGHRQHVELFTRFTQGAVTKELSGTVLADDHWGLVPQLLVAERDGNRLVQRGFGVWRFQDGAVAEHWGLVADQAAFDAFLR